MKKRPQWFQSNSQNTTQNINYTKFKDLVQPVDEHLTSTDEEKNTLEKAHEENFIDVLFQELCTFKQKQMYEEALGCIQTIFETTGATLDIIYELADIYFLTGDFERSFKWLQRFKKQAPHDCRGYLLEAQLLLEYSQKDEALTVIDKLLTANIPLVNEQDFITLDHIIEKLKRIFKYDKLLRRCPALQVYQKQRRQRLKTQKNITKNTTLSEINENDLVPIEDNAANAKGDIMSTSPLQNTISHIWDLQSSNAEDTAIILAHSSSEVSECIMMQVLSLKKKIWLFNYLADLFRTNDNLNSSVYLLRQALLLDDENDLILKNLGYLLCQLGDYANATLVLNDINHKDFAVLDLIEKCNKALN